MGGRIQCNPIPSLKGVCMGQTEEVLLDRLLFSGYSVSLPSPRFVGNNYVSGFGKGIVPANIQPLIDSSIFFKSVWHYMCC